jgi:hypothetical protein
MKNAIRYSLAALLLLYTHAAHAQYKYSKLPLSGLCHKWKCDNCDKGITIEFKTDFSGELYLPDGTIKFKWMEATKCGQIWWYKSSVLNNSLVCYVEMVKTSSTVANQWSDWDTLNVLFGCSYTGNGAARPIVFQGLNMWRFETNANVSGCPLTETNCGNAASDNCKKYKEYIKKAKEFEEKGDYTSAVRNYSEAYKLEPLLPSDCEKEDVEAMIADAQEARDKGTGPKKKATTTRKTKDKSGDNVNGWNYMPDPEFTSWIRRVEIASNEMCTLLTQMMAAASRGEMPSNPEAIEQSSNKLASIYKELTEKKHMLSDEQQERMTSVLNKFQDCVNDLTKGIAGGTGVPIDMGSMIPSFTPPHPIPLDDESAGTASSPGSSGTRSGYSGSQGDGTFEGARIGTTPTQCKPGSSGMKRKKK